MAELNLNPNEKIIKTQHMTMWYKKKLAAFAGSLYLTNQRVLFMQDSNHLLGPLVKLFLKSQRQRVTVDINLSDVQSAGLAPFGINKKLMGITMKDGTIHHFLVAVDEWSAAIMEAKK